MAKYHITPDGPKSCTARFRKCKYGDSSEHYKDQAEAHRAYADQLEKENGLLKTNKKIGATKSVDEDGDAFWENERGKLHREEGPAIEWANGAKEWYQNGKRHRVGGPAVVLSNGTEEWHQNGKLHRDDGPAAEYPDGTKEYWVEDKYFSEEDFKKIYPNAE